MNGLLVWKPLGTPTSHREAAREPASKETSAGTRAAVSTQEGRGSVGWQRVTTQEQGSAGGKMSCRAPLTPTGPGSQHEPWAKTRFSQLVEVYVGTASPVCIPTSWPRTQRPLEGPQAQLASLGMKRETVQLGCGHRILGKTSFLLFSYLP